MADSKDLSIVQGKTFSLPVHWESSPIIYKPITAMTKGAPLRIKAVGHGLTNGWRAAVTNVKGMVELNAEPNAVRSADYHVVTVVDQDWIEFNDVNAAGFKDYVSGGILQFYTPVVLTGFTALMKVKDRVGGTLLMTLTESSGISIDNTNKVVTIDIDAVTTAAIDWTKGVYELEMKSPVGVVTTLLRGTITVTKEISTT